MLKFKLNLRKMVAIAICLASSATMVAQEELGVKIGETTWANFNVGNKGEFVSLPSEPGKFYTWKEAQNVCPAGWRLPNVSEIDALLKTPHKYATKDGMPGREFGKAPNTIFLPGPGNINIDKSGFNPNGTRMTAFEADNSRRKGGYYWSSEKAALNNARYLYFNDKMVNRTTYGRDAKLSVRCVAE